MKKIIIGIALFILGATAPTVKAQTPFTPEIKHQQRIEQKRIHHGFKTGKLTRKEMVRLEMQQAKIRQTKRCAKADGVITPCERAVIKTEQARASRNIYHQKHDGQHRF